MEKISVSLRVRPFNQKEIIENEKDAWEVRESKIQLNKACLKELMSQKKVVQSLVYEFNTCYDKNTDNFHVFQTSVKGVVLQALDGINGTVIMYGQTGSGKTFTMLGGKSTEMQQKSSTSLQNFIKESLNNNQYNDIGILVYSMMELFTQINKDQKRQFEVKCSYYEIYNENIYDLLKDENEVQDPLIFGTDYRKEFVIKNLKECNVTSLDDVFRLIQVGENNRHYAETILNHQSSRSHTVFKVLLSAYMNESEDDEDFTFSTEACINFIDLAGSEKISATPHSDEIQKNSARKERNKESSSINKSLFFLTRVIALKTSKVPPQHIPYRNSTLTKLLKSSFTGNFKTLIILSINPGLVWYDQTNSTLRFGLSAKLVESKIEQNVQFDMSNPQNQQKMNQLLQKTKQQEQQLLEQQQIINELKQQLNFDVFPSTQKSESPIIELKQSVSQFSETDISQYEKLKDLQMQLITEQDKNQLLERNCSEIHKRLQKSNEQILTYFNSHKLLEDQLQEYKEQNIKLERLTQQALNRLACYEGCPNFTRISVEDINNLEQQLEKSLNQLKQEKLRRNSFQLNTFENTYLITQQSDPICRSDRSSVSTDLKKTEEDDSVPRVLRKTPQKESRPRLQVKQQSYFKTQNKSSKSPLMKKKTPLKQAKDYVQQIDQENHNVKGIIYFRLEITSYRATSTHESRNKTSLQSPQRQSSPQKQKPSEELKLQNDMATLADRLFSLSEKFSGRGSANSNSNNNSNNKYLQNMKKSEIIFETDSEVNPESRTSLLGQKQNKSAVK